MVQAQTIHSGPPPRRDVLLLGLLLHGTMTMTCSVIGSRSTSRFLVVTLNFTQFYICTVDFSGPAVAVATRTANAAVCCSVYVDRAMIVGPTATGTHLQCHKPGHPVTPRDMPSEPGGTARQQKAFVPIHVRVL